MNKELFKNGEDLVAEAELLTRQDADRAYNRAIIEAFYNGQDTMSEEDADEEGVNDVKNHLFGFQSINHVRGMIMAVATKSPTIFKVKLKNVSPDVREEWQRTVQESFNKVLRESTRFKAQMAAWSGDLALHGSSQFVWQDPWDWCPRRCRLKVPGGTSQSTDELEYAFLPDYITLGELESYLRIAESSDDSGWNETNIRTAIKVLKNEFEAGGEANGVLASSDDYLADEAEEDFQEGTDRCDKTRTKLPVYYAYTVRTSEPGKPIDVSLVVRYSPSQIKKAGKVQMNLDPLLFDFERLHDYCHDWLQAAFIDCRLGGDATWNRCMGLGELNYESDLDAEVFFNEAVSSTKDHMRQLFNLSEEADSERVEKWVGGEEWSNVLPEGLELVERGKNNNIGDGINLMQMLVQRSKSNAGAGVSNSGIEGDVTDQLEVQALQHQSQAAEMAANKMNDLYLILNASGSTMFHRMGIEADEGDPGWIERERFREMCREGGVPIEFLIARDDYGFLKNVEVTVNRVSGGGDEALEARANQSLMSRYHLHNPKAQQEILRRVTAFDTKDHELAAELVPDEPIIDADQQALIGSENFSAVVLGITPQITEADIDLIHLEGHARGLGGLIQKGEIDQGWRPSDLGGYDALREHYQMHSDRVRQINKRMGKQFDDQVAEFDRKRSEFENNLRAAMESQERDPIKEQELELKMRKQALDEKKQSDVVADRHEKNAIKREQMGNDIASTSAKLQLQGEKQLADEKLRQEQLGREKAIEEVESGERSEQGNKNQ